ncbi:MAG: hypothetical protein II670_00745, partial [Alphaproteobacteria bacterium]|nr:hypothetical protein [Alphaproteobacteria bacterium]
MANFLSKIFGFGKTRGLEANNAPELVQLCQFEKRINVLLKKDSYIARSDYKSLIDENKHLYEQFKVLNDSNTLRYFCRDNGVENERIISFLSLY